MTEFSLCAVSLALMMLGLWTINGYQELQRRAIVAARHAAYEGAWLGPRFSDSEQRAGLASLYLDDAGLTDATGQARLAKPESMQLRSQSGPSPGRGAAAFDFLIAPLRVAGGFLGRGFDLADTGFRTGEVIVNTPSLADLPAPFNSLSLKFSQGFALLSDGWNASGPPHVAQRAGGLVPASSLSALIPLWSGLSVPLGLIEPSLREFCPGLIEPDRVPEDRLGPGVAQPEASCR
jgi:hypothetical protein